MDDLVARLSKLETRVSSLEKKPVAGAPAVAAAKSPASNAAAAVSSKAAAAAADDDDDDIDLFGSDDDDDDGAADALREKRLAEYAAKKAKSKCRPVCACACVFE